MERNGGNLEEHARSDENEREHGKNLDEERIKMQADGKLRGE